MQVRFWGTRGSIAVPGEKTSKYGGNTSCVEVRAEDGTVIVLDCGTGARELGQHLLASTSNPLRLHMFIGHTHWDHIQGFPFFAPAFLPDTELNVYAPAGFQHGVEDAIAGQMQYSYFPVTLRDLRSRLHFTALEEGLFRIGEVLIQTQYLNHTAPTLAYRISSGGATVAYVTDHEPFWKPAGRTFRHPGDQRHLSFLEGADLIIHDAQYSNEEYAGKIGWGHSTVEYATDIALSAGSSRLALFHHDPAHDDVTVARLEATARERAAATSRSLEVFAAAEGLALDVRGNGRQGPVTAVAAVRRRTIAGSRVLIVSANEADVETVSKMLSQDDLVVLATPDKRAALARVLEVTPDLAIIAGRLPDGDGSTLINPLRSCKGLENLPILLLTDGHEAQPTSPGGDFSATDYLARPFSPPMLLARIRSWLDRMRTEDVRSDDDKSQQGALKSATFNGAAVTEKSQGGDGVAAVLGTVPLFKVLRREQLSSLAARVVEQSYPAGHVLIRQDEAAEDVFVVLSGRVRVVESVPDMPLAERFLGELGAGEVFGELGILINERRAATVTAMERTRCLVMPKNDFLQALQDSADLAIALLRVLAVRLYNTDRLLARHAPDTLTGLIGRRAFLDQYRRMAIEARRHRSEVVLLLFDILHLKTINDRFGYDVGDEILRTVADALVETIRATDIAVRYGGDEFAVLLMEAEQGEVERVVNRVQEKVGALVAQRGLPPDIQCLSGKAVSHDPPETADELLWAADQDLRRKKTAS